MINIKIIDIFVGLFSCTNMITFLLSSNSSYTLNCPYTAHIYLAHSIKPFEITEGEIKHGQSRDACNINHTRHRTHKHTHTQYTTLHR
jgi:hypothetical protein